MELDNSYFCTRTEKFCISSRNSADILIDIFVEIEETFIIHYLHFHNSFTKFLMSTEIDIGLRIFKLKISCLFSCMDYMEDFFHLVNTYAVK